MSLLLLLNSTPYHRTLLESADRLLSHNEAPAALVMAHMACEIYTEQIIALAFEKRALTDLQDPTMALFSTNSLANERLRDLYVALTRDRITEAPFWARFKASAALRNRAVRHGDRVSPEQARDGCNAATHRSTRLQQSRAHDVRAFDGARPFENVRASSISSAVAKSPFCGGSQEMPWWSIRAVYVHDHNDQQHFYEERIMLFRAETFEDAFDLADQESERYLQVNPTFRRVGRWTGFAVHDDADLSGAEIWSSLSRSELSPVEYYETRYERFEEEPDTEDGSC